MTTATAAMLESFDPATGDVVGSVPVTPAGDIPAIVARCRVAQQAWAQRPLAERLDALRAFGPRLEEEAERIGALLTREMGKPLAEAIGEVRSCGTAMTATLDELAEALAPRTLTDERTVSTMHYDAFGVCAAITPWNFPVAMPHWSVIPALAAGNGVVLKPSEETPLVAQAWADVLAECLPDDLLQVVHGADEQGRTLVRSEIDFIVFTGSRSAGAHILATAGADLKRVILELGGKDPLIVLADADIDAAAEFAANNSFRNAGQVCVATERIYVEAPIADAFEAAVAERAASMPVGPGTEAGVRVGPMINARQCQHVLDQIDDAIARGARVVHGAEAHHDNFVQPTVLSDLHHDMDIMCEETFGPVACIVRVADADEAVRLANDSPFGLGASVFSGDDEKAAAVARRLTAGMVGVNKSCGGAAGTPWVGALQSGYGFHSGPDGHRQFAQVRIVSAART